MSDDRKSGRGKPPKHTQFVKGQSGNPTGRPKGARGLKQIMCEELARAVTVGPDGRKSELATLAVITRMMANKAMQGDVKVGFGLLQLSCALDSGHPAREMDGDSTAAAPDDSAIIEAYLVRQERKRGGHE